MEGLDSFIYPPNGGTPTLFVYGVGNIKLGDWRPGFLEAGASLVFVTTFKLLDMLLEWSANPTGKIGIRFSLGNEMRFLPNNTCLGEDRTSDGE